ncbi:MAG: ribonuclease P protein component [Actinobacteria bacterium]|nr:ribonuclease P protein component [Actinomycetota bacterium]MBW3649907.1 ribonuclease P protein component [Actinomycetota bacterium]
MEPAGGGAPAVGRVRDRPTFAALRSSPCRGRSGPIWIVRAPALAEGPPRLAFAIGRRVGGAVVRNRLRRQLRAAFAAAAPAPGAYLMGAGPEAAGLSFAELSALVCRAVQAVRPSPADRQ